MNDPRSKTEQPKERTAPTDVHEPSKGAEPTRPIVATPQPKRPDTGGHSSQDANPKDPARLSTKGKP